MPRSSSTSCALAKLGGFAVMIIPWPTRRVVWNIRQLDLREAEEMKEELQYIERRATSPVRGMPRGAGSAR